MKSANQKENIMEKRLNIPNLKTLEKDLIKVVKEMQGEKGYVDTSKEECDTIYAILYDVWSFGPQSSPTLSEKKINGVKVEDDELLFYTEDAIDAESFEREDKWQFLTGEMVEYYSTLFSIASSIQQYEELKEYVFIVSEEWTVEGDKVVSEIFIFKDKKDAQKCLKKKWREVVLEATKKNFRIERNEDRYIEAYREGYYNTDNMWVSLERKKIS